MMIEGLSARLKDRRIACNLTRAAVSERTGVSASTIADYENGYAEPSLKMLIKLSSLYRCSTDFLLGVDHASDDLHIDASSLSDVQKDIIEKLISVMSNP